MLVTLLLGGDLRREAGDLGERVIEVPEGSDVETLLSFLSLPRGRVKLILVNGRGAVLATRLREGDRVALFPPELSFNTFVSLSFRTDRVEARMGLDSEAK